MFRFSVIRAWRIGSKRSVSVLPDTGAVALTPRIPIVQADLAISGRVTFANGTSVAPAPSSGVTAP